MTITLQPIRAQLVVIRRCNLACAYCNEFDAQSEPVAPQDLMERVQRLKALGTRQIEFTGGEPLLHPSITELVSHARRLAFEKVMMITNGLLLSRDRVEALNEAGLDNLQVSVDAVTPNSVTLKALRPLSAKLELLASYARFRVTINAVIGSSDPREVIEVVRFAKHHGFYPRVLVRHDSNGQANIGDEAVPAYAEAASELGEMLGEAHGYRAKLLRGEPAPFKCRAGCRYLYVDEWGVVRWCSQQRERFGVPLSKYSTEHLQRQFYTRKPCADYCTLGCARTASAEDEALSQPLVADRLAAGARVVAESSGFNSTIRSAG